MPFIRITVGKPVPRPDKLYIGSQATKLISDLLGKRRDVTSVLVESVANDGWCINGEICADTPPPAHCDIYITAETNSDDEKSRMIAAMHQLLGQELGAIPEASYAVIHELPATDWGYAGRTQAARRTPGSGA